MRRLLLRRGTRAEFDAAADKFASGNTVLVTDPPALRQLTGEDDQWDEHPLTRDDEMDVSQMTDFEVRRNEEVRIVRIGDAAWKTWLDRPVVTHFMNGGVYPAVGSRSVAATIST